MISPKPCHVLLSASHDRPQSSYIMSANENVRTFVRPFSALDCLMLTKGWLNAVEGDHGIAIISFVFI